MSAALPGGITLLDTPQGQSVVGRFTLPSSFDSKRYAAQWADKTQVDTFTGPQPILGTRLASEGWEVWKGEDGKQHTVTAADKKVFILLKRPKATQHAENIICGNVGKEWAAAEKSGTTIGGQQLQDPGMLPDPVLRRAGIRDGSIDSSDDPGGQFKPTPSNAAGPIPEGSTVQTTLVT